MLRALPWSLISSLLAECNHDSCEPTGCSTPIIFVPNSRPVQSPTTCRMCRIRALCRYLRRWGNHRMMTEICRPRAVGRPRINQGSHPFGVATSSVTGLLSPVALVANWLHIQAHSPNQAATKASATTS